MTGILSFLVILSLSAIITKIAALALMHTGLEKDIARFQARSAFTGVGYTTSEAENMLNHPTRRHIIMLLMLLGNAGFVTAISTLVLGFVGDQNGPLLLKLGFLFGGVFMLWAASKTRVADKAIGKAVAFFLEKFSNVRVKDYATLLKILEEFEIREINTKGNDWLCGKSLKELKLDKEGVSVLGIEKKDGRYIGAPVSAAEIDSGDTVVIYGKTDVLDDLAGRPKGPAGEREHRASVRRHSEEKINQLMEDVQEGPREKA